MCEVSSDGRCKVSSGGRRDCDVIVRGCRLYVRKERGNNAQLDGRSDESDRIAVLFSPYVSC